MAVHDASQSEDWSNLLQGVIILTICLEFLKGDISKTFVLDCMLGINKRR